MCLQTVLGLGVFANCVLLFRICQNKLVVCEIMITFAELNL